ncbi:MAG: methylmalonyl Co-A mutase-associated GTPase MeaB, partial [Bacteroidia bacterium]|nr:methylmalonyl Co-A mutase-associated GTPase MeaB [Bacteroidia bacterium]
LAHALVITKADGENEKSASRAQSDYEHALHLVTPHEAVWIPRVLCSSAVTGKGIEETWNMVTQFRDAMQSSGEWSRLRSEQNRAWMRDYFDQLITAQVQQNEKLRQRQSGAGATGD